MKQYGLSELHKWQILDGLATLNYIFYKSLSAYLDVLAKILWEVSLIKETKALRYSLIPIYTEDPKVDTEQAEFC